jgi:hypothetical protein
VTVRYVPDKLPIGYDRDYRRHVFMYPARSPSPMDFQVFILRHLELPLVAFSPPPAQATCRLCTTLRRWSTRLRAAKNAARSMWATFVCEGERRFEK